MCQEMLATFTMLKEAGRGNEGRRGVGWEAWGPCPVTTDKFDFFDLWIFRLVRSVSCFWTDLSSIYSILKCAEASGLRACRRRFLPPTL